MGIVGAPGPHAREDLSHFDEREPTETSRRVVVVDDHELIRSGTKQILDAATGFTVVGEAEDRDGALRVIAELQPDVVLVDIRLPTVNGIDLAREIVAGYPRAKVLILSAYDDDDYVRTALAAGVAGYLLKTTPSDDLILSIKAACDGFDQHGRAPQGRGEKSGTASPPSPMEQLTAREYEVVRLVVRGMTNKAIARQLGISPRTVEGHLNHVFEKLGTASRTELVHFAVAAGMFVARETERPDRVP